MKKILIVEDDKIMNNTITYNLKNAGYEVDSAATAQSAIHNIKKYEYHLIILDINLPGGSGYDICREVKERQLDTAIIFVTAKDMESDMIRGYELGADDYITKPFSIAVFKKKVAAMLHRFDKNINSDDFSDGYLSIHFSELSFTAGETRVSLSKKEWKLLKVFITNKGQLLPRQMLLEKLWDLEGNFIDDHTLTTTLNGLRKKFETKDHPYIQTVYGMGYIWMNGEKQ